MFRAACVAMLSFGLVTSVNAAEERCAGERPDVYFHQFNDKSVAAYRIAMGLGDVKLSEVENPEADTNYERWNAAIEEIAPDLAPTLSYTGDPYDCRFSYATSTLRERAREFGNDHAYVRQWIEIRSRVFQRCGFPEAWSEPLQLPEEISSRDPRIVKLQQQDRAYEIAADAYYRKRPEAQALFAAIAASDSVHRGAALYMGARFKIQQADSEQALSIARSILDDESLATTHPMARQLIGTISYYSGDPGARAALLDALLLDLSKPAARILNNERATEQYRRSLYDLSWFYGGSGFYRRSVPESYSKVLSERTGRNDLGRWLATEQAVSDRTETVNWAFAADGEQIRESLKALMKDTPSTPIWFSLRAATDLVSTNEIWKEVHRSVAANKTCWVSPHNVTLARLFVQATRRTLLAGDLKRVVKEWKQYPYLDSDHGHAAFEGAIAYLLVRGRREEARLLRDNFESVVYPDANRPRPTALLMLVAEDREHAFEALRRKDFIDASLLNLFSVGTMQAVAADPSVPAFRRETLARSAWAREYALNGKVGPELTRLMLDTNPKVAAVWSGANLPQRADHQILLNVLRTPRMTVIVSDSSSLSVAPGYDRESVQSLDIYNHSDNNWWCALQPTRFERNAHIEMAKTLGLPLVEQYWTRPEPLDAVSVRYLNTALAGNWFIDTLDRNELERLSKIDSAPKFLATRAVEWASEDAGDAAGLDEALHRAVVATRYGCQRQGGHGTYSKAAYRKLHKQFADSEWTKKTPHWFDCSHFFGRCRAVAPMPVE